MVQASCGLVCHSQYTKSSHLLANEGLCDPLTLCNKGCSHLSVKAQVSEVPAVWRVVLPFLFHWWPRSLRNPSQAKVTGLLQYGLINTNKRFKTAPAKAKGKDSIRGFPFDKSREGICNILTISEMCHDVSICSDHAKSHHQRLEGWTAHGAKSCHCG